MSRLAAIHPSEEELLRYADGEMPAREAGEVHGHLAACWQCRSELEGIERTISECVRYRKALSECSLPSPPTPWCDIHLRFAEIDSAPGSLSFVEKLRQALRPRAMLRWAAVAASVALLFTVADRFRNTPSVRAAALLRQAVAHSSQGAHQPRRLRIRTATHQFARMTGSAVAAIQKNPDEAQLQGLFASAHFDWADPLDPRAFAGWRDRLTDKTDDVSTLPDPSAPGREIYRIRTTTAAGTLEAATLDLRAGDFGPVQETLEFRDRERVEIIELPLAEPESAAPVVAGGSVIEHPRIPGEPAAAAPLAPEPVTAGEEVRVFAALHRLGADLGEPVEVARNQSGIVVTGIGIDNGLKQRIEREVAGLPGVEVRVAEDQPLPPGAEPAPRGTTSTSPERAALQDVLERALGGKVAVERFTSEILDQSELLMARAHALRRLSEKFPARDEAGMSAADRHLLRQLGGEHARALLDRAAELERRLTPVFGSSPEGRAVRSASWQSSAQALFRQARRVEILVAALSGGTPSPGAPMEVPADLLRSLAELRAQTTVCLESTEASQ